MNWKSDAALAGQLDRGAKVYLTMLIARCVQPGEGQGRRNVSEKSEKSSTKGFADHAGMSDKTVTAYLKTWDAMAADGIVPPREELTPGVDVDLPDQAKWVEYYRAANQAPQVEPKPKADNMEPVFQAEFVKFLHEGLSSERVKLLDTNVRTHVKDILRQALDELEPAKPEPAELEWNPGNWDADTINRKPVLVRLSEGMQDSLHGVEDLGNEGIMLARVGQSVLDFIGVENKVTGMAQMMQSITEFAASYRITHK